MKPIMVIRLVIDLGMTFLMLFAMAYQITGNTIHELLGGILLVFFIVHNILNRRWYKTIMKGKYNLRRLLKVVVNLLFLVSMVVVLISSLPISQDIFPFMEVNDDMIFRQIHVITAYWGFIFMAIHIGVSWGVIVNSMRKMTGISGGSRIRLIGLRLVAVLIVIYGVKTSFERDLESKLVIYDPFASFLLADSVLGFLVDYLSIMGIYISGTHYALKFVQKNEKVRGK
ncbi:DUF4405 domain-containing protein [Niallia sp.]|uniref:DUF4405 domain-containing protein n=1 Tax=Niallia sp. TaxID=2837523 RepID=UPI00289AEEE9|nr:DUF4405 domain-containing protein [Niallia sp.]